MTNAAFLSKGFAPLRAEFDLGALAIEGTWPAPLRGAFYRIGPNPQFEPRGVYNPLQGDGMVHAFFMDAGRVSYRNRWVRTQQWREEKAAGRALYATSGAPQDHDPSVAGKTTDGAANTNLVWHGRKLLALEEGHGPIALDPATLDTLGPWTFADKLPRTMCAHPKIDPETGEMAFVAAFEDLRAPRRIGVHCANAAGALTRSLAIEAPFAAIVHDCALTRDYILAPVCPSTVSIKRAMAGGPLIAWTPELGAHVAVIARASGETRWFAGAACMAWHVVNAFNEGGRITLDVCSQAAAAFPLADGAPVDPALNTQRLTRWTMDWDGAASFTARTLHEERCEYPRIDEALTMQPYRYAFVARAGGPGSGDLFQRGLGRFDHRDGAMRIWDAGAGFAVSEPVFASCGVGEAEGYVLANIYDEARDRSFLAAFDAHAIEAGPVAKAHLPHRVPVGFHGLWVGA